MNRFCFLMIATFLAGCAPEPYPHRFSVGDCVKIKLTDDRGMVLYRSSRHGSLIVRVGRAGTSNSGFLGPTVKDNEYLAAKRFNDFELDDCPEHSQ